METQVSKDNNEPVEMTTTNSHKVVFRPFAPQKFIAARKNLLLSTAKMNMNKMVAGKKAGKNMEDVAGKSASFGEISGSVISEINDLAIKYVVKSIDGKTGDDMFDYYEMDMRDVDCHEVLSKALDIIGETTFDPAEKKA